MSMSLYWEPENRKRYSLGDKLKYIFHKKLGGFVDTILDRNDISFLEGLAAAGVENADRLIIAIETHGAIRVWEE